MSFSHSIRVAAIAAVTVSPLTWAAVPASGELSETEPLLTWTGAAPFVFPNVSPASGMPVCDAEPVACDTFALGVAIGDEYRADEANKKETVKITVSWPNASGAGDFDVYFRDAGGALVGEAATSANPEVIVVPMSVLKNGGYSFEVIPFAPLGDNYSAEAMLGKKKKSATEKSFSITPAVTAPATAVQFDARALASAPPAGGYTFTFGDGTQLADNDGVVEHSYANNGAYLARVTFADPNGSRGTVSAAQTVVVQDDVAAKGSSLLAGGFGVLSLLGLFAAAGLRRRI